MQGGCQFPIAQILYLLRSISWISVCRKMLKTENFWPMLRSAYEAQRRDFEAWRILGRTLRIWEILARKSAWRIGQAWGVQWKWRQNDENDEKSWTDHYERGKNVINAAWKETKNFIAADSRLNAGARGSEKGAEFPSRTGGVESMRELSRLQIRNEAQHSRLTCQQLSMCPSQLYRDGTN